MEKQKRGRRNEKRIKIGKSTRRRGVRCVYMCLMRVCVCAMEELIIKKRNSNQKWGTGVAYVKKEKMLESM